jgi:hypothetical protein
MTAPILFALLGLFMDALVLCSCAKTRPRGLRTFVALISYKLFIRDILLAAYRHDPLTHFLLYWASSFGLALLVCAALQELGFFDPDAVHLVALLSTVVGTVSILFAEEGYFALRLVHSFERGLWSAPLFMIAWGLLDKPALISKRDRRIYAGFCVWVIGRFLFAFAKSSMPVAPWANALDALVSAIWIIAIAAPEPRLPLSAVREQLSQIATACDSSVKYLLSSGLPIRNLAAYDVANIKRRSA